MAAIVCTLGKAEHTQRAREFRQAFRTLVATESFANGFRWRFADLAAKEELLALAAREGRCCSFFQFTVFEQDGSLVWETRAETAAAAVLEEFMRLPEALALEGSDGFLALERAGLAFDDGLSGDPAR